MNTRIVSVAFALPLLVSVVVLSACGAPAQTTTAPSPVATPTVEASAVAGDLVATLTGPSQIATGTSASFKLVLHNGSDVAYSVQPRQWALSFTGITYRLAMAPILAPAWRDRKPRSVSLPAGGSLELTYTASFGQPALWHVAPSYIGAGLWMTSTSATITVR